MTGPILVFFTTAIELTGSQHLILMLPLCLSIAIVYKTTRCRNLREVPAAALILWITIVIGMYAVGISLWVLFQVMA
jgi:hypothetical protein